MYYESNCRLRSLMGILIDEPKLLPEFHFDASGQGGKLFAGYIFFGMILDMILIRCCSYAPTVLLCFLFKERRLFI